METSTKNVPKNRHEKKWTKGKRTTEKGGKRSGADKLEGKRRSLNWMEDRSSPGKYPQGKKKKNTNTHRGEGEGSLPVLK